MIKKDYHHQHQHHTYAYPYMYPHTSTHACTHTHRPWSRTHIRRKKNTLCVKERSSPAHSQYVTLWTTIATHFTSPCKSCMYGMLLLVFNCLPSQRNFLTDTHIQYNILNYLSEYKNDTILSPWRRIHSKNIREVENIIKQ